MRRAHGGGKVKSPFGLVESLKQESRVLLCIDDAEALLLGQHQLRDIDVRCRSKPSLANSREGRFQYFATPAVPVGVLPGATLVAPRIAAVMRFALNPGIRFSEEMEFLPNVLGDARFLFNTTSKLSAKLTTSLAITASFLLTYDSAPAGGKKPLDTSLALGLEAAF